jgi:hypothetical protein
MWIDMAQRSSNFLTQPINHNPYINIFILRLKT